MDTDIGRVHFQSISISWGNDRHYLVTMSFAGHVLDMIARVKATQQRRRNPFDKHVETGLRQLRHELLKPCLPEVIERIRLRSELERKRANRIHWVTLSVLVILISLLFGLSI